MFPVQFPEQFGEHRRELDSAFVALLGYRRRHEITRQGLVIEGEQFVDALAGGGYPLGVNVHRIPRQTAVLT
jgi:hypothetical protein